MIYKGHKMTTNRGQQKYFMWATETTLIKLEM